MSVTRTFTVTVANPGAGNRYYIDGILHDFSSTDGNYLNSIYSKGKIWIGGYDSSKNMSSVDTYFTGQIKNFKIWSSIRTQEQLQEHNSNTKLLKSRRPDNDVTT